MRRLLVAVAGVFAVTAFWSVAAFGAVDPTGTGFIEICKTLGSSGLVGVSGPGVTNPATASFEYTVTDGTGPQTVDVRANAPGGGTACSAPIAVSGLTHAGGTFSVTVAETVPTWAQISALTVTTNFDGATTNINPIQNPVTVEVMPAATPASETRLDYTNTLVTGFIEVCKSPAPNSGLASGTYTFRIRAGANTIDNTWAFDQTVAVGLNQCSSPIAVPAGGVNVQETGTGVFITDVQQTIAGSTTSIFGSLNSDNSVDVTVAPSANAGNETLLRFFDALSTLKICKVGGTNGFGTFTGPASFTITGAAGATSTTVVAAAGAGNCVQIPGSIVPGSTIGITEAPTVGAVASSIVLNGNPVPAPGTVNLATGTVSFTAVNGANVITYTNVLAAPVLVKICKVGTAGMTATFGLNGVMTTGLNDAGFRGAAVALSPVSVTIPTGATSACTQPLGPFAFGSTLGIQEGGATPTSFASATIAGNGSFLAGSPNAAAGTAAVLVGMYDTAGHPVDTATIAVVTIVNGTAPTTPSAPSSSGSKTTTTPPSTTSGGSSSGSSTTSASSGGGTASASTGGVAAANTPVNATSLTPTPTVVNATPAKSALTAKLVTARILFVKQHGLLGRWLGVQLKGTAATTKVKIQLIGSNGKLLGSMIKTVKTGQLIRVMKVGAQVRSIKVTPLPSA